MIYPARERRHLTLATERLAGRFVRGRPPDRPRVEHRRLRDGAVAGAVVGATLAACCLLAFVLDEVKLPLCTRLGMDGLAAITSK
jgi:hypothetical protein